MIKIDAKLNLFVQLNYLADNATNFDENYIYEGVDKQKKNSQGVW